MGMVIKYIVVVALCERYIECVIHLLLCSTVRLCVCPHYKFMKHSNVLITAAEIPLNIPIKLVKGFSHNLIISGNISTPCI